MRRMQPQNVRIINGKYCLNEFVIFYVWNGRFAEIKKSNRINLCNWKWLGEFSSLENEIAEQFSGQSTRSIDFFHCLLSQTGDDRMHIGRLQ